MVAVALWSGIQLVRVLPSPFPSLVVSILGALLEVPPRLETANQSQNEVSRGRSSSV